MNTRKMKIVILSDNPSTAYYWNFDVGGKTGIAR